MSFFDRNLAIMKTRDPELAALMESEIDCSHIEVIPSNRPGVPTAWVTLPSREKVLLHNMEDPIGSAQRSAQKQEMKAENASLVLGLGLGYFAFELAKKLEKKHPMIVCEADPAILKTALTHVDLTELLDSDYIRILVGQEIPLHDWIHKLSVKFMTAKVDVISYGPSLRIHPDVYERLTQIAQKESRAIILNRNTTVRAGRLTMHNILENFPDVVQSTGVKRLENLFSGRPAILVAAGPSLEKNVHLLREVQGRAVIIAVDTTLRLLLPLGIIPDLVTTIDFNLANYAKFENIPIPPDISLVYHPAGYYESIRAFHGPRFTQSNTGNRLPAWLMKYVDDKGFIQPGTTVAHLSFHLARHLGCDPIAFIGQDLAFTGDQQHAADLSLWHLEKEDLEVVEDIFGEPVRSMPSFRHAIHHFEKVFKETTATVIDATEAGAKKQGAKVMRLRDVIDEYGDIAPTDIKGTLARVAEETEHVRMEELLSDMRYISAELGLIKKDCREILGVAKKLGAKINAGQMNDDGFVKLSYIAEKLTGDIEHRGRSMFLLGEQNYALELYMMQHATVTIDEIEDTDEKIKQQVDRARVFYPSLSRAAETFKKPLDRLIHRLEQAQELAARKPDANATAEEWYKRALAFRKIEYRKEAYEAFNQTLARDPHHAAALKALVQLCLDTNRFQEAMQLVRRSHHPAGSDRKLQAFAKEAESKHRAWTERCERLRAEFVQKEQEDSCETAGWFYYRTKDYVRAISKLEQAIAQRPTPEAYARLGRARLKAADVNGAIQAWEQGLSLDARRPDLYKELGDLALDRGLKEQGEQFLEEALRHEPDDAESCQRLATLYYERGAYVEAGACLENLLRLSPERQDLIPQIMALYQRQLTLTATSQ